MNKARETSTNSVQSHCNNSQWICAPSWCDFFSSALHHNDLWQHTGTEEWSVSPLTNQPEFAFWWTWHHTQMFLFSSYILTVQVSKTNLLALIMLKNKWKMMTKNFSHLPFTRLCLRYWSNLLCIKLKTSFSVMLTHINVWFVQHDTVIPCMLISLMLAMCT